MHWINQYPHRVLILSCVRVCVRRMRAAERHSAQHSNSSGNYRQPAESPRTFWFQASLRHHCVFVGSDNCLRCAQTWFSFLVLRSFRHFMLFSKHTASVSRTRPRPVSPRTTCQPRDSRDLSSPRSRTQLKNRAQNFPATTRTRINPLGQNTSLSRWVRWVVPG